MKEQGKLEEAIASFRTALELEPRFAGTEFCLAIALLLLGRLEEGFARYEARLALFQKGRQTFGEVIGTAGLLLCRGFARQLRLVTLFIPE